MEASPTYRGPWAAPSFEPSNGKSMIAEAPLGISHRGIRIPDF